MTKALSLYNTYKNIILESDDTDLPGHEGLPILANSPKYITPTPPDPRHAAVVLLIHANQGIPSILFIERSSHILQDQHRGQIAFPGGQQEAYENLKQCAFRELEEEIGVRLSSDHPTRKLTPLYVSVSNFLIHPFVAFKNNLPLLHPSPDEVASIIDSPLIKLHDQYPVQKKDMIIRGEQVKNVPYFQVAGKVLWGATALIFSELLHILENGTAK